MNNFNNYNSEENEETQESKKREWKDEKKEVFHDNKKDESFKSEDEGAGKDDDKSGNQKSAARHAESRYSEVPMSSMVCHVCNKRMWDGSVSNLEKLKSFFNLYVCLIMPINYCSLLKIIFEVELIN